VVGADADSPWFDVQNVSSSEFKVKDMSVIVKDDDTRIFLSIMIILSFALLENYQLRYVYMSVVY
jgi:hypothetical protein